MSAGADLVPHEDPPQVATWKGMMDEQGGHAEGEEVPLSEEAVALEEEGGAVVPLKRWTCLPGNLESKGARLPVCEADALAHPGCQGRYSCCSLEFRWRHLSLSPPLAPPSLILSWSLTGPKLRQGHRLVPLFCLVYLLLPHPTDPAVRMF